MPPFHEIQGLFSAGSGRVQAVTTGSSPVTVATYDYLGLGRLVGTTLDQAQLSTSVFTESGGTHTYADLDGFNRPTEWNWERVGGAAGGFYDVVVAYDENSNPTSTVDQVHIRNSTAKHLFDVVYSLDGLNRVTGADEGHKSGGSIGTGDHTRNEIWGDLSLTGNWGHRQLDANGDGVFTGPDDREEPLANNAFSDANEWTGRRVAKTGADKDEYAYTYDAVGNLTREDVSIVRGLTVASPGRVAAYCRDRLVRRAFRDEMFSMSCKGMAGHKTYALACGNSMSGSRGVLRRQRPPSPASPDLEPGRRRWRRWTSQAVVGMALRRLFMDVVLSADDNHELS